MPSNADRAPRTPEDRRADGRLYGRRQDRPLKPRQARLVEELLPKLSFSERNVADLIARHDGPVAFEVGFGGGEHLAWQAEHHPGTLFFGAEPFINGVAKLLAAVEDRQLSNVRILEGDARPALSRVPDGRLEKLFLLQPDPWPKRKHHKRRMVSQGFFDEAARLLRPAGELRISSDIADYVRWTLMHWRLSEDRRPAFEWAAERAEDWKTPPADWPRTRYAAKGEKAGRPVTYLMFRRVP